MMDFLVFLALRDVQVNQSVAYPVCLDLPAARD